MIVEDLEYHYNEIIENESVNKPEVPVKIKADVLVTGSKEFKVIFNLNIGDNRNGNFTIKCKYVTIFITDIEIEDEFLKSAFVRENSLAIAFPYLRSFVMSLTANAGIQPFILPTYNFSSARKNN